LDEGVDPKTLSDRIGHANTWVTLQIYGHRSHGRDSLMAQTLADLIQSAVSPDSLRESPPVRKSVRRHAGNASATCTIVESTEP